MGRSWAFFRPYRVPPFVTRLIDRDGVVGRHYFEELARSTGADLRDGAPGGGVLRSIDELESDAFDPTKIDPLVRAVWEETTALEFRAEELEWSSVMKPFAPLNLSGCK